MTIMFYMESITNVCNKDNRNTDDYIWYSVFHAKK